MRWFKFFDALFIFIMRDPSSACNQILQIFTFHLTYFSYFILFYKDAYIFFIKKSIKTIFF